MHRTSAPLTASDAQRLSRSLGWFSIAVGALQLLAPRRIGWGLGTPRETGVIQAFGAREIATGIGLLAASDPKPWIWARLAGDAIDIAALAANTNHRNPRRETVGIVLASVVAVTVVDLICLASLDRGPDGRRLRPVPRDYSDRSGYPRSAESMRGAARLNGTGRGHAISDRPAS